MTNYEKYKDEILKHGPSGFGMKDGNIDACWCITCSDCYFSSEMICSVEILDWLFEEYREEPVLTKQELIICDLLEDGYLTKIKNKFGTNLYYSKIKLLDEVIEETIDVDRIKRLPSAQPEIIRCRDCKYYETMYCKMDVWTDDMRIYKAKPNDYCSYAVRGENE